MDLQLMYTTSDVNVVDKTVELVETISIRFKRTDDIKNPKLVLTVSEDVLNKCNYAYIPFFSRYYFIGKKQLMTNKAVDVELNTDPLMTFKEDILSSVGNLTQSTMIEYVDTSVDMQVKQEIDVYTSPKVIENKQTQIMTTLGDGK